MNLSHSLILLDGEIRTQQIESIEPLGNNAYRVRFRNSPKLYTYSASKVEWVRNPEILCPDNSLVYRKGVLQKGIEEILKFTNTVRVYWRINYESGFCGEYIDGYIQVITSCLDEETAKNTLAYLRKVAKINPLRKEGDTEGILAQLYEKVDFINDKTAAACYLNPSKFEIQNLRDKKDLIYPFGCNASQKIAVSTAFEKQISVIQGPPGTGKTQTILNIIANIVRQGKTVMVVSNNNSATANVAEKLEKYGVDFIVAPLGSRENKEAFVEQQHTIPKELSSWKIPIKDSVEQKLHLHNTLQKLDKVYELQNKEAELRLELDAVELEWKHFCFDNGLDADMSCPRHIPSKRIINLWLRFQSMADDTVYIGKRFFARAIEKIKLAWMKFQCQYQLKLVNRYNPEDITSQIKELQTLYYLNKIRELKEILEAVKEDLLSYDAKELTKTLTDISMLMFCGSLYDRYHKMGPLSLTTVANIRQNGDNFTKRYPVVLSTTFSARSCLYGIVPYDYIIMDEASQVSIETGALALTCAKNAVIVGDALQLPNVVTEDDKAKLSAVMNLFSMNEGYDCCNNSFLDSVCKVIANVPETMLREHYRCHPRIINFCNQKFYGGNLLIMTNDEGEEDVLCAYKTVEGNHAVDQYNQREIDVVKQEVLPTLQKYDSIGIVTPYNNQVRAFLNQLPQIETATIHRYQGREKDAIVMSVVNNQINDFADDANLLNVAVSRAKKKFCLVVTGNEQAKHGNIMDLLDYINYNNCTVTKSKVASIFDYLYEQYSEQRKAMLDKQSKISEFASEILTFKMLNEVIADDSRFSCFKVLCHIPLRNIIQDMSLIKKEEEIKYASNYKTHTDFLVVNRVTKKPVLAVETDGYSYHNDATEQHRRDMMKDHIFQLYNLPLLRLSTKGSGEKERVIEELDKIVL